MTANKAYGDTEGPLGIPMSSEQATAIEAILKDLPADCRAMVSSCADYMAESGLEQYLGQRRN